MAHFAKLGVNGKVLSVEVVADADCQGAVILLTKIVISFGLNNLTQVGQKTLQLLHGFHQSLIHQ